MKLVFKTLTLAAGRDMYIAFPDGEPRTAFKRGVLTIFRDDDTEGSVQYMLQTGLAKFCDEKQVILAFPNPVGGRWNYNLDPFRADDMAFIRHLQGELRTGKENKPSLKPLTPQETFAARKNTWHPMNDAKYLAGFGTGAAMAMTVAALEPAFAAGIYVNGGTVVPNVVKDAKWSAVPAFLNNVSPEAEAYFLRVNGASPTDEPGVYRNKINPNQCVIIGKGSIPEAYDRLLSRVRRPNTGKYGDIERRMLPSEYEKFEIYIDDSRLSDGVKHTWFTHVPASVKAASDKKVPLMVFFHGATDSPAEAAEMSKFHELGEKEGFITVYPWGTNLLTWNTALDPEACDDEKFSLALIDYMIENYPVDPERVYLSGFSNGAAQTQVIAVCHPDKIAAICPIDSNWPGSRTGESDLDWHDIKPLRLGMEKKEKDGVDYRMPVWYTYGNREPAYPVYDKSTQQHQYDFWKMYNNIAIKPTAPLSAPNPCGCGVPGDIYERIEPSAAHPHHAYDAQRFLSEDAGNPNLYNYVVMLDKGHDIAEKDPELGWNFVKQFRRKADGSLEIIH